MKNKYLALTLLSQLAIAPLLLSSFTSTEAKEMSVPILQEADKSFLKGKITYQFDFPIDARDKIINEAARYLNQEKFSTSKTYQELLDDLIKEDDYFSTQGNGTKTPLIPGAFLDAASALYREAAEVISPEDFEIGTDRERQTRAEEEKVNFTKFADILDKQARIISTKPIDSKQAIASLKIQLDNAVKSGKDYKKVYVYSDKETYRNEYQVLLRDYPGYEIVFLPFPAEMDVFFRDSEKYNDGLVYIEQIPESYLPYYDPIWYPYYERSISIAPFVLGFAYPYAVYSYWDGYYGNYGSKHWGGWKHDHWRANRFGDKNWHKNWIKERRLPRDQKHDKALHSKDANLTRGSLLNRDIANTAKGAAVTSPNKSTLAHDRPATKAERAEKRKAERAAKKAERAQKKLEKAEKRKHDATATKQDRAQKKADKAEKRKHDATATKQDRAQKKADKAAVRKNETTATKQDRAQKKADKAAKRKNDANAIKPDRAKKKAEKAAKRKNDSTATKQDRAQKKAEKAAKRKNDSTATKQDRAQKKADRAAKRKNDAPKAERVKNAQRQSKHEAKAPTQRAPAPQQKAPAPRAPAQQQKAPAQRPVAQQPKQPNPAPAKGAVHGGQGKEKHR